MTYEQLMQKHDRENHAFKEKKAIEHGELKEQNASDAKMEKAKRVWLRTEKMIRERQFNELASLIHKEDRLRKEKGKIAQIIQDSKDASNILEALDRGIDPLWSKQKKDEIRADRLDMEQRHLKRIMDLEKQLCHGPFEHQESVRKGRQDSIDALIENHGYSDINHVYRAVKDMEDQQIKVKLENEAKIAEKFKKPEKDEDKDRKRAQLLAMMQENGEENEDRL